MDRSLYKKAINRLGYKGKSFSIRRPIKCIAFFCRRYLLIPGVAVTLLLLLWLLPSFQVSKRPDIPLAQQFSAENEARRTLAQILGGLALLVGLFQTWRRVASTEKQVEVAREVQLTDRFTKAIEQLGNGKLEVRLGGIYALERIARDSKKDHWPIMEVLTAYVRENSFWPGDSIKQDNDQSAHPTAPTDIQAILSVIGRRKWEYEEENEHKLNLARTDLRGINLWKARLARMNLQGANLSCSTLTWANLLRADLSEAILDSADLGFAKLGGADFKGANLRGSNLNVAEMIAVNFSNADLTDASLCSADLSVADFKDATMKGAKLRASKLISSRFAGTHLERSSLCNADFSNAFFFGTHLEGADLTGAENLTNEQLRTAYTSEKTILPHYIKFPLQTMSGKIKGEAASSP